MKKKIIKGTLFILIMGILWINVFKILWLNKGPIHYFYNEPQNSLDVLYFGASNANYHFNPTLAFQEYGFATGMLSSDSQPFFEVKYLLKESLKYQHPKLYVIDLTRVYDNLNELLDVNIRRGLDAMKFTQNRIDAYNEALDHKNGIGNTTLKEYINHYFSFFLYHNAWKEISEHDFHSVYFYKGYILTNETLTIEKQNPMIWNDNIIDLPSENRQILIDLLDFIKENQLNVLFVIPSRYFSEDAMGKLNDAKTMIGQYNIPLLNCNEQNDLSLNLDQDFFEKGHLNVYGATKNTLYFGQYLKEHYSLEDHRKSKEYLSWEEEYEKFKNDFQKQTNKSFDDVLKEERKTYERI